MYRINKDSKSNLNVELAELRHNSKEDMALNVRKFFDTIKNKVWENIPESAKDLTALYNGQLTTLQQTIAGNFLIGVLEFELVEALDLNNVVVVEDKCRFAELDSIDIPDMSAKQLSLLLFKDLGTEIESSILSMNSGLKVKLDLLDELKEALVEAHPNIRPEVLQAKLANALALTKLDRGSSLTLKDGQLAVYDYLADSRKTEAKDFMFLADMLGDKTQSLDVLILKSAFKTYKDEVAKGKLQPTSNELNLAIVRALNGVKPVTADKKEVIKSLKFN